MDSSVIVQKRKGIPIFFLLLTSSFFSAVEAIDTNECDDLVNSIHYITCNSIPSIVPRSCMKRCFDHNSFATFGYYIEEDNKTNHGEQISKRNGNLRCVDFHEEDDDNSNSCETFVEKGDCVLNPGFMLYHCAKSCLVCREPG